ncbi:MAG: DUF2892 domain-containing protein [Thiotrichales bacterium]|nr:DUF2892 domain-containing protein [Thiotrichales bacterium]
MNIGLIDRILRIGLGALLIALAYMEILGAWGYIGIVPLITGLIKWCPMYTLLGIQTCPVHANIKYPK